MFRQRIASLVVVAFSVVAGFSTATAHAQQSLQSVKIFKNARFGYTISLPALWHQVPPRHVDFAVDAPDNLATITGLAVNGALPADALRVAADTTIERVGTPRATIVHTTRVIHGVSFQLASTTITGATGEHWRVLVCMASQHQHSYLFFGLVGVGSASAQQAARITAELGQIQDSFNSITIAS